MTFVNFSNHSSNMWNKKQREEAEKWGTLVDVPFPNISAEIDENEIESIATKCVESIVGYNPKAVMCQGEFTLVYAVVSELRKVGITVVAACSNRIVFEEVLSDGSSQKCSVFEFVRFREYR